MLLKSCRELLLCLLLSGSVCATVCPAETRQHVDVSSQGAASPTPFERGMDSKSGADRSVHVVDAELSRLWKHADSGDLLSAVSAFEKLLQAEIPSGRLLAQGSRKTVTEQVATPATSAQISLNSQTSMAPPSGAGQASGEAVQQFAAPAGGSIVPGQTPPPPAPLLAPASSVKIPGRTARRASADSDQAAPVKKAAEVSAAERKADAEATKRAEADSAKAASAARKAQAALKAEQAAATKKAEEEARAKAEAEEKAKAEREAQLAAQKKAEAAKKAAELAAKKKADEEARKQAEAQEAARKAELAAAKKAEEQKKATELAAKKRAEEEAKVAAEVARKAELAAKKKAAAELKAAEVAAKKAAEEEARKQAEAEKKAKAEREAQLAAQKKAEAEKKAADLAAAKKAEEEKKVAELAAKKRAEEEAKLAAEEARKAELAAKKLAEEDARKQAEAEKKAKAERDAELAAQKKAEEEKKAAELAAKKKADEEARKQAEATEAARKAEIAAAKKAEAEAKRAAEAARKEARSRASKTADEALKLYNSGKYDEAVEKFTAALNDDPESEKALAYKPRALKKWEAKQKKDQDEAARKELESQKAVQLAQLKAESPTPTAALPAPGGDDASGQSGAQELKPLTEIISKDSDKKKDEEKKESSPESDRKAEESQSKPSAASPAVEADKLVRQSQRELQEGKRTEAVETARRAASLDPNNVEAKALLAELDSGAAGPGLALPSLRSAIPPPSLSAGAVVPPPAGGAVPPPPPPSLTGPPVAPTPQLPGTPADIVDAEHALAPKGMPPQLPPGIGAPNPLSQQEAEAAFQKGLVAYQSGQLDAAVQQWNYALTLSPAHPGALQYLDITRAEYDAWVQQHQYNAIQLQKEAIGVDKLDTPITYDTAGQKTISEFLQAMSILTDVNFYVAAGVDPEVRITAKFEDTPLYDALDVVLLPIGLKWSRTADTITITPDLRHKYFNLTPDQVARLKPLLENKTVQKYLYGPEGLPAMRNVELLLDPVQNSLIVTDSQENINKLEAFLKDLQIASPPGLIFKSFKIRPEEGQKIKALVEAIVNVQSDAPFDLERKVAVDGDDLIIKDTADNIAKIEQLLLDKNFIRKLETQKLDVATFNLTPREPIIENVEQARDLAQNIVTVVKTILYAQTGESAAAAEGRRYFYDPNTLQLTITDFPENLRVVGDYVRSLPMLSTRTRRSDIIFLKHQGAAEMAELLQRVLGITAGAAAGPGVGGNTVTKNLSTEQEITFQGIRVRLLRVNENNVADENDDSAEFVVRTPTTSQDVTLQEFRSQFIEDYELSALQIRPSGTLGQGSVRLEIRYVPGGQAGGLGVGQFPAAPGAVPTIPGAVPGGIPGVTVPGAVPGVPGAAGAIPGVPGILPAGAVAVAAVDLQIETIENMNALLVRYEDPGDLAELKGWIEQLDIPVLQVSIETKLVEVNESRAKEWLPEFNILNLEETDISGGVLDARFANDADEFRSPFDPFPEDPRNAGLLKGRTVLSFLALGGETGLNFTLRTLEAEGVLNMVNGPHVLVENGGTADFEISRRFGDLPTATAGGVGGQQGAVGTFAEFPQVRMTVAPQITQLGEIRLDIQDLELNDFGNDLGAIATIDVDGDALSEVFEPTAVARDANLNMETRSRRLTTVARVSNGGTIVLGGWTGERSRNSESGVPILRNIPYVGKLLFGRTSDRIDRTNLLIFLTCNIIAP